MKYSMLVLRLFGLILMSVLLPTCTSNLGQTANNPVASEYAVTDSGNQDQPNAASDSTSTSTSTAAAVASVPARDGDYRISPRDVLDISVFQVADLNKSVQVSEDGTVTLPLVGKVDVGGKTTQQAEEMIADRLRKSYLQSPQVSVSLKQYGQRVTISGEVKAPRVLTVDGKVTVTEAIASAGGLSDLANAQRVHIARKSGDRIKDEVYDLSAIQSGQAPDPTLKGGDIVVVEQSGAQVAFKNMKDLLPFAILANLL